MKAAAPIRLVAQVHRELEAVLREGDIAIDATAGNGHDTLFLAGAVGAAGRVWAVDCQKAALGATRDRLLQAGLLDRCDLFLGDHALVLGQWAASAAGKVAAVVFNLG